MKKTIGLLLFILGSVQSAYAFDNNRKGFFVGVGGGIHSLSVEFNTGFSTESESKTGFASTFKIGGGITDNFVLYYVRNASWYKDTYTFATGIAGLGAAYYFNHSAPSPYVHGGIGAGDVTAPFDSDVVKVETGTGALIGAGYQFSDRLSVEGTYMAVDVDVTETSSFQLLVNILWY